MIKRDISHKAIVLTERYEGYSSKAYPCLSGKQMLIGYGHACNFQEGYKIDPQQARKYLLDDLKKAGTYVNNRICQYVELDQNQYDALVCFAFNLTTIKDNLFECLINKDFVRAVEWLLEYRNVIDANGKKTYHLGLHRRRVAEAILFTGFEVNTATLSDIRNRYTEIELLEFSKNLINWYENKIAMKQLAIHN